MVSETSPTKIERLYIEGGGDEKTLRAELRQAFGKLLEAAGLQGRMPRIKASGGRAEAYNDLCAALTRGETALLLIDAEEAVPAGRSAWAHVAQRAGDRWERPAAATDAHLHLMTQLMETWFLAQPPEHPRLAEYFGQGFQPSSLPHRRDIENIPKTAVLASLSQATRNTKKGTYSKGKHSFNLLAALATPSSIQALEAASPRAKAFFDTLRQGLP